MSETHDSATVRQEEKERKEEMDPREKAASQRKCLRPKRYFTDGKQHPFDKVEWTTSKVKIEGSDGAVIFNHDVEHPAFWDEIAVRICADKYFKIKDVEGHPLGGERSVKDVIHRVAFAISRRGELLEYFDDEGAKVIYDEVCHILLHQMAAFNSPVFFNWGLYDVYGFKGRSKMKRWAIRNGEGEVFLQDSEYENAVGSACYITEISDELMNGDNGIYDWIQTEMSIFANGSGSGCNVSCVRGEGEHVTGGGKSSGVLSFLKIADTSAGAIKSGGKTRRAAKLLLLNDDHPDVLSFIDWKKEQEFIARSLILAGLKKRWSDDKGAYAVVTAQNGNNSVAISDAFMKALLSNGSWSTRWVKSGEVKETFAAAQMYNKIIEANWECGDPGLFFVDTINSWNTIPNTGRIDAANPCVEFMQPNNSACNLASLNLVKFLTADQKGIDLAAFRAVVETFIVAMEIIAAASSYPTKKIAEMVSDTRPLGIGYCNLGGLLMRLGYPYDSEQAKQITSVITSLETAIAYGQSARIAAVKGPFREFPANKSEMMGVLKRHLEKTVDVKPKYKLARLVHQAAVEAWEEAISAGNKFGFRNCQASVLAPTGTISLLMGTTNNGIEPPYSLIMHKFMSDGSVVKLVTTDVADALKNLGYSDQQVRAIEAHVVERLTMEGAPFVSPQHLAVFDTANVSGNGARFIRPMAHVEMIAAAQPFLSGGISKTINMPESATKEEMAECFIKGWQLGCKALTVYRDGSKWSQPLNSSNSKLLASKMVAEADRIRGRIRDTDFSRDDIQSVFRKLIDRKRPPQRAPAERFDFKLGGENVKYAVARYPDNGISEILIELGKEGETVSGLVDTMARLISISIQYGVPIEAICDTMSGQQYSPSGFMADNPLKIHSGKSIADLTAKLLMALKAEYDTNPAGVMLSLPPRPTEPSERAVRVEADAEISSAEEAKRFGFSGVRCENCGSWRTIGTVKCGQCTDCSHSYGSCG